MWPYTNAENTWLSGYNFSVKPPHKYRTMLIDLVRRWRDRERERRELLGMTDRELRDIGMTTADVQLRVSTPFWRD